MEDVLYAHSDVLGSLTYLTKSDGSGYIASDYGVWGEVDLSQALNDFDFVVTVVNVFEITLDIISVYRYNVTKGGVLSDNW